MGRYATDTSVPVERTRAEIEATLVRYHATEFVSGWKPGQAMIAFRLKDLYIRFALPIPDRAEKRFTHKKDRRGTVVKLTDIQAENAYHQELRSRWRALLLVIKAKLEAVECGISTIEQEFLAFIVLPSQITVGEWFIENAMAQIKAGHMPPLLGSGPEGPVEDAEILPVSPPAAG